MKKHLKLLICILILSLCAPLYAPLWGADFGIILDQTGVYSGSENNGSADNDNILEYSGALIPRFSVTGDKGGVYVSASAIVDWKDGALSYLPELLRTEFFMSFGKGDFAAGRMTYADPLGIIAVGLFDGAAVSLDVGEGSLRAGGWYTGFLYKERARITMTQAELVSYNAAVDYENFTDTYFAPRRALAMLGWEHQALAERAQVQLALLGQFDLGEENALNTQYAAAKITVPVNALVFSLGGCVEAIEYADEYNFALAGEFGVAWMFAESRISLSGRYSSGVAEDGSFTAFLPLTTVYQGNVLRAELPGISTASLDYLVRLHQIFSIGVTGSCFFRTDLGTYTSYPVSASADDSYILGAELFGRFLWSPFSDMQINLGGGTFVPTMGTVHRNAPILWRVELNLVLALY